VDERDPFVFQADEGVRDEALADIAASVVAKVLSHRLDGGIGEVPLLVQVFGRIGLGHAGEGVEQVELHRWLLDAQNRGHHRGRAALIDTALPDVAGNVNGLFQERVQHVAAIGRNEGSKGGQFVVAAEFALREPGGVETLGVVPPLTGGCEYRVASRIVLCLGLFENDVVFDRIGSDNRGRIVANILSCWPMDAVEYGFGKRVAARRQQSNDIARCIVPSVVYQAVADGPGRWINAVASCLISSAAIVEGRVVPLDQTIQQIKLIAVSACQLPKAKNGI